MPPLVRYVISNFAAGFGIGSIAAGVIALLRAGPGVFPEFEPAAAALQLFSLGAPFGLGFLGTALMLDAEE